MIVFNERRAGLSLSFMPSHVRTWAESDQRKENNRIHGLKNNQEFRLIAYAVTATLSLSVIM